VTLDGLSPAERLFVGVALRDLGRSLRRDGRCLPPRLERLAGELLRDASPTPGERRRALSAARSRRYRARKRGLAASGTGPGGHLAG